MISGLSRLRRLQMLVPRTQIALEVSTPWYMQTAGDIPNDWDIDLVLRVVIRQFTKLYTHFACCQVLHFLWWGGKGCFCTSQGSNLCTKDLLANGIDTIS